MQKRAIICDIFTTILGKKHKKEGIVTNVFK
jgi:hypothetical protein